MCVRVFAEGIEIGYAQRCIERIPRLHGRSKHRIAHVIDALVRKPGAFAQYRYQAELFPTHRYRLAYDTLHTVHTSRADKAYLRLLQLAATESQSGVDAALGALLADKEALTIEAVRARLNGSVPPPTVAVAPFVAKVMTVCWRRRRWMR